MLPFASPLIEASNHMNVRRRLGSSEITVCPIGLGGMPMSIYRRQSEGQSIRVILAALEAGMNFIDTADAYCLDDCDTGHNERLIAGALKEWKGHSMVVATKGGCIRPHGAWQRDGRPEHLRRACERSLIALGVERITLYQLHGPDPNVPFADSVGVLADLQRVGKIQHIGLSNVSVRQIVEAVKIAPIVSVQNRCNFHDHSAWRQGVVQHCEKHGIAFLPYSPVGGRAKDLIANDPCLKNVAQGHQATPFEVALAWLLARSPVMIPIPGASRVESAVSSAKAMQIQLSEDDMRELNAVIPAFIRRVKRYIATHY
jgi:aryl-alcohol dehydrogenase-like predicted oxidoreductase